MKTQEKTYQGKITDLKLISCNVFGIRAFEIHFATGKVIYQVSIKKDFNYKENDFISFTGDTYGDFFIIEHIVSPEDVEPLREPKKEYCGKPSGASFIGEENGERIFECTFRGKKETIKCSEDKLLISGRYQKFTIKEIEGELYVDEITVPFVNTGEPTYNVKAAYGRMRDEERFKRYAMENELMEANQENTYNEVMEYINN